MSVGRRIHPAVWQPYYMKAAIIDLAAVAITACITPTASALTCFSTSQIDSTNVVDAKTIDFKLNNGQIYRNTMPSSCNGLTYSGFIYNSFGAQVCDYQSIRVLQSAELCKLGAFAKESTNAAPGR
jgi:hypothetical protein